MLTGDFVFEAAETGERGEVGEGRLEGGVSRLLLRDAQSLERNGLFDFEEERGFDSETGSV